MSADRLQQDIASNPSLRTAVDQVHAKIGLPKAGLPDRLKIWVNGSTLFWTLPGKEGKTASGDTPVGSEIDGYGAFTAEPPELVPQLRPCEFDLTVSKTPDQAALTLKNTDGETILNETYSGTIVGSLAGKYKGTWSVA